MASSELITVAFVVVTLVMMMGEDRSFHDLKGLSYGFVLQMSFKLLQVRLIYWEIKHFGKFLTSFFVAKNFKLVAKIMHFASSYLRT